MFEKYNAYREKIGQKADELQAKADKMKADAQAQKLDHDQNDYVLPFHENENCVVIPLVQGKQKQAWNSVSLYHKKGFRVVHVIEREAAHASYIVMERNAAPDT